MKKSVFILTISLVFILQACSWREYFVITNQTSERITIEYEVNSPSSGIPIFDQHPSGYQLDAANDIDWKKPLELLDHDAASISFKIVLEPNHALVIGYLSNDHYEKRNQYFINGRSFNLKKLVVQNKKAKVEISPENFDEHFFKEDQKIMLRIKK